MSVSRRCAALTVALGLLLTGTAWGQAANTREQEQIRRLRQQVQQLQQEQTVQAQALQQAQAEQTKLKAQLATAGAAARGARAATARGSAATQALQKEIDSARQDQQALQATREELTAQLQINQRDSAALRANQAQLRSTVAQRDNALADLNSRHGAQALGLQRCINNNQALYTVGQELVHRLAKPSIADAVAFNEPFLQLRRVSLENLIQGYQDKLDQQALKPTATEPGRAP